MVWKSEILADVLCRRPLNMIAKWYISRQFQNEQPLAWDCFKRLIGLAMVGERECIKKALNNIML